MKKRNCLLSLILACVMCFGVVGVATASENVEIDDANQISSIRLIDVEQELLEYLDDNYPELVFGSKEFVEYAVDVLMYDIDEELSLFDNYADIRFYLGEYLHELNAMQLVNKDPNDRFLVSDEMNLQSLRDVKAEVKKMMLDDDIAYSHRNVAVPYYTFDASAAAAYAKKYATTRADEYPIYDSDCTNFVSQAIHAGGIDMRIMPSHTNGITQTTDYWYCLAPSAVVNPWHTSSSWVNVDDFYSYAIYKGGASRITCNTMADLQAKAAIGDVVQLCNEDGNWYHSIIITSGSKGAWNYCGHTNNREDKPLQDIVESNKFRIIRF